ncbi:TonB-dependent receptor [Aquabacter spiritensis]|uniref:TonB-dependent receptor n=1 Tax=Aquabacter spiritensis TaxID=933073 RepID=UPI001404AF0E|nr:TonB-dependent siderophore receptor [Aquabacter spiritensis]
MRSGLKRPVQFGVGLASAMVGAPAFAQQAAPATELELPTVQVQDNSGGFLATTTGVARLPVPIFDMPQQVNVVTEKVLQQQNDTTLEQALRNVSGITFSAGEGGNQGDSPIIRGFSARGDIFRDGIRDTGWYTRDMFNIEAVEVFMGPSSFAFGRGSTGGVINMVSKLPKDATFAEVDVTGYSQTGWRTTLDANGKLNDNVYGRINLMGQNVDTAARDNVNAERWGIAPSVTVKLNDRTTATASYYYQYESGVPDYGIPYLPQPSLSTSARNFGQSTGGYYGNGQAVGPVPVPRSNWYGVTNGPFADDLTTETNMATFTIEHELNDFVTLSNGTRYTAVDRNVIVTAPRSLGTATNNTSASALTLYPVPLMTIGQQRFNTITDNTQLSNITDMVAKFQTGIFQHTMNAGMELTKETRNQSRVNLCSPTNASCRVSLWAPNNTSASLGLGGYSSFVPTSNSTDMTDIAFYAGDQIQIGDQWQVMGSFRWDIANTTYSAIAANGAITTLQNDEDLFNYRFGVVYSPLQTVNLYLTYGTSSNPSSEFGVLSNDTVTLAPESNETLEAGVKAEVLNGQVVLTGAVFQTIKTNTRVPTDPLAGLPPQVLGGEQRVRGVSLGAAGAITEQWDVTLSYTYMQTEILSVGPAPTLANLATVGNQLPNAPQNSFSFWTSYDITPQITVAGGATYNDKAFVNTNNTAYVPSYWSFDAMASYQVTKNFQVQLNVYNITDELYYAQYYGGHAVPAAGRSAALTARATF